MIVQKCRHRLHWITRKVLLLLVTQFEFEICLTLTFKPPSKCKTNGLKLSYRADIMGEKMGGCRLGLSYPSYAEEFRLHFLVVLVFCFLPVQKSLSTIFINNFSFSCASEFSHYFNFGKLLQETVFFIIFFLIEKKMLADFFK